MSTYKRRIVYFTDEQWETIGRIAEQRKTTISATIRDLLPITGFSDWKVQPGDPFDTTPTRSAQAQKDDLLRKINRSR